MSKTYAYVFTVNNYTDEDVDAYKACIGKTGVTYCIFGREVGEKGTPHLQGYLQCNHKNTKRLNDKLPCGAHIMAKGSWQQNYDYCTKEGDHWEGGTPDKEHQGAGAGQGERTDLIKVKKEIEKGTKRVMEIAEEEEYFPIVAKHSRFFKDYEYHVRGKKIITDREPPKVYIRIGDAGSGKTRWLDEQFGLDGWARMPNPTSSWWITEHVSYSDTVLIDDVGPSKIPKIEAFLEWTDRYPIEFNSKGGHLWWKPKNIVITSNCSWRDWWPEISEAHLEAVQRRIYRIDLVFKDRETESIFPNEA